MKAIITVFLFVISTSTFAQSNETYKAIGDSLMAKGQYEEVIKYFNTELKKHPKNEEVLRWLGYVHIANNKLELGEKYYLQAIDVNPQCGRCYMNIGRVYSIRGDNKNALEYFDKAVTVDPKDAVLYSNRGRIKEMLGDKSGALRDHNKAIEMDASKSEFFVARGLYYSSAGYYKLAISDLTNAIVLSPYEYYPYFQRANIFYIQDELDKAMADINTAINLDSNQSILYNGRGAIFDDFKKYQLAIDDYSKAISLNKNDYLPYLNRAASYYKLEELDAYCSDYSILKSMIDNGSITDDKTISDVNLGIQSVCDSSKPSYYYQRGVGYFNLEKYTNAIAVYERGLAVFPDNAMMLSFKGNTHFESKDYKKAIELYEQSLIHKGKFINEIKINPRFIGASDEQVASFYNASLASIYFGLSQCKLFTGQYEGALADIDSALKLAPAIKDLNLESYYNLRGHVYSMLGQFEQAISDFNLCLQINKNFPMALVNRAIASVNLYQQAKISSCSNASDFKVQPLHVVWVIPNKSSLKKYESTLLSALSDCNAAIELDNHFGYGYYIRGQIKKMLASSDYCSDFLVAKGLGLNLEDELLKNCGN